MKIEIRQINGISIAEVISGDFVIREAQNALDLMADASCQGADKIIARKENLVPEFFDLKTGLAGDILQKFSTYRVQLAIVGDFSVYPSKSLRNFIYESNEQQQINFVETEEEALKVLAN